MSKHVIKARDSRLALVDVAIKGFIRKPPPTGTQAVDLPTFKDPQPVAEVISSSDNKVETQSKAQSEEEKEDNCNGTTQYQKKKKEVVRCLGPRDPHLPHLLPTTQFQNTYFLSLADHTFFVLLFISFSLNKTNALLSLTLPPVHSSSPYTSFFQQGSPENFIGKAKAH